MRRSARSFPIALRFRGQDLYFLGTDIVTGWFFAGFQDDMPLTACWQKHRAGARIRIVNQQSAWQAALLTRGVHVLLDERWTPMTLELVQRLGGTEEDTPGADLVYGYLSGLGWFRPGDKNYLECDLPTPEVKGWQTDPMAMIEKRRALTTIPGKNILWAVKEVAQRSATSAHRVWRSWPISSFIWSWRVSVEPELTAERAKKSQSSGLTPEMQAVGVGNG
jgi:hypothetical protein